MDDLTGQTIGQYRLVRPLGEGGMAQVYQAYQSRLDRYVALKFIRPELAVEASFRTRFEQEAKAIAKLNHGNIVHIYDFGEEAHRYFLVMEYVDGRTLKEYLQALDKKDDWVTFTEAVKIIKQVASALGYAHQEGIVHRDVKPDNIMLTKKGRAVLNDFGIAKMIEQDDGGMTKTGTAIGTPAYMSPEQVQGQKEKLGPTSDLYSLGIILYELLIGKPPFTADTAFAIMLKHVNDPIPMPRQQNPGLSEPMELVLLKLLAKEPADRFQTAEEFVEGLEAAVAAGGNAEAILVHSGSGNADISRFNPLTDAPTVVDGDESVDADMAADATVVASGGTQVAGAADTVVAPAGGTETMVSAPEAGAGGGRRWWLWGGGLAVVAAVVAAVLFGVLGDFGADGGGLGSPERPLIVFADEAGQLYGLEPESNSPPQNISRRLDAFAPGEDSAINVSPNGEWFVVTTTRGDSDCAGWACLVVIERDFDPETAEVVYLAGGEVIQPEGRAVINSDGDQIVYVAGGVNELDLWLIEWDGDFWTEPILLTAESPFAWNVEPSIRMNGDWVVFTCSDNEYAETGGHICEVNLEDRRLEVLVYPDDGDGVFEEGENTVSNPDYAPGGDVVFTATWERTWVWVSPNNENEPLRPYGNDGRLRDDFVGCVLPDDRLVTLRWADAVEGAQLVITPDDGSESQIVDFDRAVRYGSVGCSG